jgi:two-component sensor histidine kinase
LLLDGDCNVIAASTTFSTAFALEADAIVGRSMFALGDGEWDLPRLRSLLSATAGGAAVPAYEIDLKLPGRGQRRLVLNAQKLSYAGSTEPRLLLAVADVTDARLSERIKDDLLREKAVLMQEIQHRVANSLQIIASVLMQNARKVGSEESRLSLRDAHNRVLAIAELQRQLSTAQADEVALGGYFTQLCQSIGASMIDDHNRISLTASADDSRVTADVSVSLGLVVTELVINALKHAFPGDRPGHITVDYAADGADWTLKVSDDGIGMPAGPPAVPGLGTSIVNALAKHLESEVVATDAGPGTTVSLIHHENDEGETVVVADPAV